MKKLILIAILLLLTITATVLAVYFYPKQINLNAQGINYRLGTEHIETENLVNVQIEGKLYNSIFGNRRFKGTIDIEGEEIPIPVDDRLLNMPIAKDGWGVIDYPYFEYKANGAVARAAIYQYGSLVINKDFTKVSIMVADQNQANDGDSHVVWSADNGEMITAPASSRSEAIQISNEIMEIFLKGYQLQ